VQLKKEDWNMIVFRFAVIALLLTASYAFADEASKAAKLKELVKIQGLYEIIEQQKSYCQEQVKLIAPKMLQEAKTQFPGLKKTTLAALENAYQKFLNAAKPAWTTEEAVNAWSIYYGLNVTEDELDSILAFYRSPIGQKDTEAAKIAMQQWTIFFMEKNNVTIEKATQAYISELRAIIKAEAKKRRK